MENTVIICVINGIEDAFIGEVHGSFTIEMLQDIQNQFRAGTDTEVGPNTLWVEIQPTYFCKKQYNNVSCLTLQGWDLKEISRKEI